MNSTSNINVNNSSTTSNNDEHEELLAEMELIERLPTQDRLRQAKRRRTLQLKRWQEYEREMTLREQQLTQHHHPHQHHNHQNGAIKGKISLFSSFLSFLFAFYIIHNTISVVFLPFLTRRNSKCGQFIFYFDHVTKTHRLIYNMI